MGRLWAAGRCRRCEVPAPPGPSALPAPREERLRGGVGEEKRGGEGKRRSASGGRLSFSIKRKRGRVQKWNQNRRRGEARPCARLRCDNGSHSVSHRLPGRQHSNYRAHASDCQSLHTHKHIISRWELYGVFTLVHRSYGTLVYPEMPQMLLNKPFYESYFYLY